MVKVYAWPPVCASERSLRTSAPVSGEESILTGKYFCNTRGPKRRVVSLSVVSHGADRTAAGYMEALERLLDGGVSLVRLSLWSNAVRRRQQWLPGGVMAVADVSGDLPAYQLTNVPERFELLRPDETFTVGGVVYRAVNRVIGSADRTATVKVADGVGAGGALTIGGAESGVFRVTGFPEPSQPISGAWYYDWTLREVFESEVSNGFEEINPWV